MFYLQLFKWNEHSYKEIQKCICFMSGQANFLYRSQSNIFKWITVLNGKLQLMGWLLILVRCLSIALLAIMNPIIDVKILTAPRTLGTWRASRCYGARGSYRHGMESLKASLPPSLLSPIDFYAIRGRDNSTYLLPVGSRSSFSSPSLSMLNSDSMGDAEYE